MQNLAYENEFDLLENEPLYGENILYRQMFFHRLVNVLTQRCTVTRKWPMEKIKTDSALCSSFL